MDYTRDLNRSTRLTLRGVGVAVGAAAAVLTCVAPVASAAPAPVVLVPYVPGVETTVAAGGGHLVAMRSTDEGSELVELQDGKAPRQITTLGGDVTPFSIGTDRRGRAVAIVQPCIGLGPSEPVSSCALSVVDLLSGKTTALKSGIGAVLGDLDHGRAVVVRPSKRQGVAIAIAKAGATGPHLTPIPLGRVVRAAPASLLHPASRTVSGIDLHDGIVATVVEYAAEVGGGSMLLRHTQTGGWQHLAHSGYGEASGIPRVFRAPAATASGVRAFFDGGDNDQGYAARWSGSGKLVRQVFAGRFGAKDIVDDATFDGDTLVTAFSSENWCAEAADYVACGVNAFGPVGLG